MMQNTTTVAGDLERLAHWGCQTLKSDRHELRGLLRAWCQVSGLTVRNDLVGGIADHVHAQYTATRAAA